MLSRITPANAVPISSEGGRELPRCRPRQCIMDTSPGSSAFPAPYTVSRNRSFPSPLNPPTNPTTSPMSPTDTRPRRRASARRLGQRFRFPRPATPRGVAVVCIHFPGPPRARADRTNLVPLPSQPLTMGVGSDASSWGSEVLFQT